MRLLIDNIKWFFVAILISMPFVAVNAQSFDYKSRPILDFQFKEVNINLKVNPSDNTLSGLVQYNLQANINGADTLRLDAVDINVDSVKSAGQSVHFVSENNVLKIALTDSSLAGTKYQVTVYYQAAPQFGLLKSSEGTIWTSMLPRSTRHWLPVKDNPRIQATTALSLHIPANYTAFGSGVKTDDQLLADSTRIITFTTGRPIPINTLSFGVGKLRESGSSVGIKRINSYAEFNSIRPAEQSKLINETKQILPAIEQKTGMKYPYQRVQLVILNDHYWEQKPYGASTIFLYKNRGDWETQLRRGLYAQWFGVYSREEQWANSWPVHFMQMTLHYSLHDSAALLKDSLDEPETDFTTVYDHFSAANWNFWQKYAFKNKMQMKQLAEQFMPGLLQQDTAVLTPELFNDMWYRLSGQPSMRVPRFKPKTFTGKNVPRDSVRYRVNYHLDDTANTLQLVFNAQAGSVQQPVTLPVEIESSGHTKNSKITFSGKTDTVSVSLPAGTQNVQLQSAGKHNISLEEHKPISFMLYQLRNGATPQDRKEAAIQIGYDTDDPDLQLALNEVMKQKMEPEVKAALLRSYGKITHGDEGTQQRFLEALQSDNPAIRASALTVLGNYKSQKITDRLKTFSTNEANTDLSDRALKLYMQRIDSSAAISFTNSLVQQDTAGTKAISAIAALAGRGNTKQAVHLATFYIEPVYAYAVRKQALQILVANDASAENWKKRTGELLNDFDPRIRYLMAKNIDKIPGIDAAAIVKSRLQKEYDARVYKILSSK